MLQLNLMPPTLLGEMNLEMSYLLIQISSLLLIRSLEKHKLLFKPSSLQSSTSILMSSLKVIPEGLSRLCRTSMCLSLFPCLLSPRFQSCSKFSFIGIFLLFLGMLISFLRNWLVRLLFIIRMDPFQSFLFLLGYFSLGN